MKPALFNPYVILVRILLAAALGLSLVLWPQASMTYAVILVGLLFFLPGLLGLIALLRRGSNRSPLSPLYGVGSIGTLLMGVWLMIMPAFFAKAFFLVLGFVLVLGGLQQIIVLVDARRWATVSGWYYLLPAVLMGVGLYLLFSPQTLIVVLGWAVLVYALSELFYWVKFMRSYPKEVHPTGLPAHEIEEAEIVEG